MAGSLTGFFSYSRRDDEAHGRQLSAIRGFLADEVETFLGRPFELFQDVEQPNDGQPWEPELIEKVRRADVLIPVLTPSFFASEWCRREFSTFVDDDTRRGRGRPVFPLYFVVADELEQKPSADALATAVRRFRVEDIRDFRVLRHSSKADDVPRKLAVRLRQLSHAIAEYGRSGRAPSVADATAVTAPLQFEAALRADDTGARRRALVQIQELLATRGYREGDLGAVGTVFHELCENVARHVGGEVQLHATADEIEGEPQFPNGGFHLTVSDPGPGFDLDAATRRADAELARTRREHGLLRAFRLGVIINELGPHRVHWLRGIAPSIGTSAFSPEQVVPVVFSWTHEAIRINDTVFTFDQWRGFKPYSYFDEAAPGYSDRFMDLVFDPLLRPGPVIVGIEITGHGWTNSLPCTELLREVHAFIVRSRSHLRGAVVYVDADASDQWRVREFAQQVGWPLFETLDRARAYRSDEAGTPARRSWTSSLRGFLRRKGADG